MAWQVKAGHLKEVSALQIRIVKAERISRGKKWCKKDVIIWQQIFGQKISLSVTTSIKVSKKCLMDKFLSQRSMRNWTKIWQRIKPVEVEERSLLKRIAEKQPGTLGYLLANNLGKLGTQVW